MAVITKSNRVDIRIDSKDKEILERAAEINHLSLSSYILSVCLKQAEYDIRENEMIKVDAAGRDVIMRLLEEDEEPNDALKELFK